MIALQRYEVDHIVDTLRELRQVCVANDSLDDDLEQSVRDALDLLGVADVEEN